MILDHLKQARWNKTKAAISLGISRRNLIRKVKTYELERRTQGHGKERPRNR